MSSQSKTPNARNSKQLRAVRAAAERKKAVLLLQRQMLLKRSGNTNSITASSSSDADPPKITDDMISETMLKTLVDRIESALPKRYVPSPSQSRPHSQALCWKHLPFLPLKRNVSWLQLKQQDRNVTVSVAEELLAFASYVKVIYYYRLVIVLVFKLYLQQNDQETKCRTEMLDDICRAITSKFPQATVNSFGSHALGLSVFFSDLDISILGLAFDKPSKEVDVELNEKPSLTGEGPPATVSLNRQSKDIVQPFLRYANPSSLEPSHTAVSLKRKIEHVDLTQDEQVCPDDDNLDLDDRPVEICWTLDAKGDKQTPAVNGYLAKIRVDDDSEDDDYGMAVIRRCEEDEKLLVDEDSRSDDSDLFQRMIHVGTESDYDEPRGGEDGVDDSEEKYTSANEDDLYDAEGISFHGDDDDGSIIDESDFRDVEDSMSGGSESEYDSETDVLGGSDSNGDETSAGSTLKRRNIETSEKRVVASKRKRKLSEDLDFNVDDTSNQLIVKPINTKINWANTDLSNDLYFAHAQQVETKESESRLRLKYLDTLRALFGHIKTLGWVREIELRSKAKVPIINVVHNSGVHIDISMGLSAEDTTDKVRLLYSVYPEAFLPLACFLKVFLFMHDLDKPFTGGIGSYKLYVMIAFILSTVPALSPVQSSERPGTPSGKENITTAKTGLPMDTPAVDLGYALLAFFKYFGNRYNLNNTTTISVHGVDAEFDKTFRVDDCRKLFDVAHDILLKRMQEMIKNSHNNSSSSSGIQDAGVTPTSAAPYLVSNSTLGMLLDTKSLNDIRGKYLSGCKEHTITPTSEKIVRANEIIKQLLIQKIDKRSLKLYCYEDVLRVSPQVACKLLSFPTVESALARVNVKYLNSHSSGPGFRNRQRQPEQRQYDQYHYHRQQQSRRSYDRFDEFNMVTSNFNRKPRFSEISKSSSDDGRRSSHDRKNIWGSAVKDKVNNEEHRTSSYNDMYDDTMMKRLNDKCRKHTAASQVKGT
jgi:DNA polymerase sigma